MQEIQAVIFDWGDTLMRDLPQFQGPMAHWPRVELIPGALRALESIHGRLICCVASNAGDSDATLMGLALKRTGIRRCFDHLWTSRELGAAKPHSAFFQVVQQGLGLESEACVMVGNDYAKDIAPAKTAGMRTVWLASLPVADAPAADAVIHSMEDLNAATNGLTNDLENKPTR